MTNKVLITSALLYANGKMHPGHLAGAYLPADCYARFERLLGSDVHFLSGSDEYGIAIALNAKLEKTSPKQLVDTYHAINQELFQKLDFSYDIFARTTWEGHKETVHQFFLDLLVNGHIEQKETQQLFSEKEQEFLADRYVVGTCPKCGFEQARGDECPKCSSAFEATDLKNPRSKITGAPLVLKKTTHWFLRFDQFKQRLNEFLAKKQWKQNVVHFVKNYIDDLKPRAITRDIDWGIEVPLDEAKGKVLYVWFDAPIGYISASKQWSKEQKQEDLWEKYWLDPATKLVHFIGKDNIPFHAVFFPAMIMGQNVEYKLVDELPANEFLNLEGKQFSKSDHWMIDLDDLLSQFSSDQIRYALAAMAPENADSEFTWKDFQQKLNGDLLGKYGNLVNRVMIFCQKHTENRIPDFILEQEDKEFTQKVRETVQAIKEAYANFQLRKACQLIMELATYGNSYFDAKAPWKDAKNGSLERMKTTLYCCLECLKHLAYVSNPILPQTSNKIWAMLNLGQIESHTWEEIHERLLEPGAHLSPSTHLFQKVEDEIIQQNINKLYTMETTQNQIAFEDFTKVELTVGLITEAKKVEKSNKLLHLTIDIGQEKRSIVSGIAKSYAPEDVIDRKVIVVTNLKPIKLMGIESHGMVLAADGSEGLKLSFVDHLETGSTLS